MINEQMWIGHFDVWTQNGVVMFRHALLLTGGGSASDRQCEAVLGTALDSCERYFPAFQFVVWAGNPRAKRWTPSCSRPRARRNAVVIRGPASRAVSPPLGNLANSGYGFRTGRFAAIRNDGKIRPMSASDPSAAESPDLRHLSGLLVLVGAGKMGGALLDGWLRLGLNPANVAVVEPQPSPQIAALADRGVQIRADTARTAPRCRCRYRGKAASRRRSRARGGADDRGVHTCRVDHGRPDAAIPCRGTQHAVRLGARHAEYARRDRPRHHCRRGAWRQRKTARSLRIAFLRDRRCRMGRRRSANGCGDGGIRLWTGLRVSACGSARAGGRCRRSAASLAEKLARETVAGSGELLHRSALPAATLRENVTSPGGTTAAALKVLMGPNGLEPLMKEAIAAATKRSRELAG